MDLFDDDSWGTLKKAQKLRLEVLNNVIGDALPDGNDLERAQFIMSTLRDVERVEIDIAKVKATYQQASAANANAAIMLELMKNMSSTPVYNVASEDLCLPDELEAELIEGEADLNYRQISFDELEANEDQ